MMATKYAVDNLQFRHFAEYIQVSILSAWKRWGMPVES